jgi:glycine cleavage system H lipoate-binding protein
VLVRERVRVVDPTVELTGSPSFTLAPWDDRRLAVSGQTSLAPGTTLDVRALQEEDPQKLWRNVVTVDGDGSFEASFAFGSAIVPGELPLWVLNHRTDSEETVSLTEAEASLSFRDQRANEQSVVVENVSLSHGGFVEVTGNGTGTVGVSAELPAGDHGNVSVPLVDALENETTLTATAVADATRNASLDDGDVAYEVDGAVVSANASVRPSPEPVDNVTTTANATTTTTAGNDTSATAAATTERSLDTEESSPLTPDRASGGSGGTVSLSPVLVVVALAAGVVLAVRA